MIVKCANLSCENTFENKTGRRPKVYCSPNCKQKCWQKLKFAKSKKVVAVQDENGEWMLDEKKVKLVWAETAPESFDGEKINHLINDELGQTAKIIPPSAAEQSTEAPNNISEIEKQIVKIEENLKLPAKYLPKAQRDKLETKLFLFKRELAEQKSKTN